MKILITSLFVSLALPGAADIITMKDGTKIDATILNKTLEEYELEVNVTKTIKERRTIKRADVADVEIVSEYNVIFEDKIAKLIPTPTFLSLEDYDARIKLVEEFLDKHKLTSAGTKATNILSELKAEREVIANGGLKIAEGEEGLITAEEILANEIEIDSKAAAAEFEELVAQRAYLAALRRYTSLETEYFGTTAQREAMPLMRRLANTYSEILSRELKDFGAREESRQASFDQLSPTDQKRALEFEEKRKKSFELLWDREEKEEQIWFSVDTKDSESMAKAIDALEGELEHIHKMSEMLIGLKETGEVYRKGWIAAGEKNKEELEGVLDTLEQAGISTDFQNKLIDRFDPTINNPSPLESKDGEDSGESEQAEESEQPEESEKEMGAEEKGAEEMDGE